MDLFDRFAGNDSWHTRRLLEYAGTLTEEQLDRPLPTVVELLPWRESNKTLRQLLENIIFTKEVWTAALSGAEMDMCPGGEQVWRNSSVTVCRGVCLTHQRRHKHERE